MPTPFLYDFAGRGNENSLYTTFVKMETHLIHESKLNGTTQCSGDDSSPCSVTNITCVVEWYHLSICHPDRNKMERRDLPKWQSLPYAGYYCNLGGFLRSARNDISGGGFIQPHGLFSLRCMAMNHRRYMA